MSTQQDADYLLDRWINLQLNFIVTKQSREKSEQTQNQHSAWSPQDRKKVSWENQPQTLHLLMLVTSQVHFGDYESETTISQRPVNYSDQIY